MFDDVIFLINQRQQAIENFLEANGYESYDPYDGLKSQLAGKFVGKNQFSSRLWQQVIRLSPIGIRSLFGVQKMAHTKAISDFASAYSMLNSLSPTEIHSKEKALFLLEWLFKLNSPSSFGTGWGLRFPFVTRFISADEQTCNIFQTINAIHAFLDGYRAFGDPRYLEFALQGFEFAEKDIGYTDHGNYMVWNYWKGLDTEIYNVNGLMIGLTARLFSVTRDNRYVEFSRKLCAFVDCSQNQDGSWFYSADQRGKWVDGFHTGYILEGLCRAVSLGVIDIEDGPLRRGSKYYLDNMFDNDHLPKYLSSSTYPIDVQNCAQAIQTLVFLARMKLCSMDQVFSVLKSVDSALWNKQGYYNYYKTRLFTYKTPMHRWGTGPMFLALTYVKTLLESGQ